MDKSIQNILTVGLMITNIIVIVKLNNVSTAVDGIVQKVDTTFHDVQSVLDKIKNIFGG